LAPVAGKSAFTGNAGGRTVRRIPLAHQTLYAELQQQTLDAAFDGQFPENGSFVTKIRKGRKYWYLRGLRDDIRGRN
jgi:hypothetical protein